MATLRTIRLLAFAPLPLIAACGDAIPQASDEQLLNLLGEHREAHGESLPPSLSRSIEECVRLLSGLEDDIVQDIPDDVLGHFKADCRRALRDRLDDDTRNPMGLELAHFENREFGERISQLAEPSRLAAQLAAQEARERRQQAQLDEAKETITDLLASLDERFETFDALCTELGEVRDEALSQDVALPGNLRWYTPSPCHSHYAEQVRTQVEQAEERLNSIQPNANTIGFRLPYLGVASPERLDAFQEELENSIRDIKKLMTGT